MTLVEITVNGKRTSALRKPYIRRRTPTKKPTTKPSRKRSKPHPRPTLNHEALYMINSLEWDVRTPVYEARSKYNNTPLGTLLATESVSLLVPAASKAQDDQIAVLYELVIRKKKITILDVLRRVSAFYMKRVTRNDVEHLHTMESLSGSMLVGTPFHYLLGPNTLFTGLAPQIKPNMFMVLLKRA